MKNWKIFLCVVGFHFNIANDNLIFLKAPLYKLQPGINVKDMHSHVTNTKKKPYIAVYINYCY